MSKLHIVSVTVGAEGPDQSQSSRVVGAYTDPIVADCVRQVAWGDGAVVTEVEVDFIDPELRNAMHELGVEQPTQGYGGGRVVNNSSPYSR